MKMRVGASGVHMFSRETGSNILFDEIATPPEKWSISPRHVSIALTNACNLACHHCYAPKHVSSLNYNDVIKWAHEFDKSGTLGIGFGGGEPTLYPQFPSLCSDIYSQTKLAITFTTHGHQLSKEMISKLTHCVNFVRLSMDGIDECYESIRGRPFKQFIEKLTLLSGNIRFGVNFVVNQNTVDHLSKLDFLSDLGCEELLLLPQNATSNVSAITEETTNRMSLWVSEYSGNLKLSVSEIGSAGLPVTSLFSNDSDEEKYAHIDADGFIRYSSYSNCRVKIKKSVIDALEKLKNKANENME